MIIPTSNISNGKPADAIVNTFSALSSPTHFRDKTGLYLSGIIIEPIIFHQQPDKGMTIIEKLEDLVKGVSYAVALLSPDDVLENGTRYARPNVLLEVGVMIGHLTREKVRLIRKGDVTIPSDLDGILRTEYGVTDWQIKLLKEIKTAGLPVDLHGYIDRS